MASNLVNIPDHFLWLGLGTSPPPSYHSTTNPHLGIFTFLAMNHASRGLHTIRATTRITKPLRDPQPARLPSNPTLQEDAISTSSLLTLATSSNIDIRSSATKILCHRFYASKSARRLLVADLASPDEAARSRATRGFALLRGHGVFDEVPVRETAWRLHEPAADAQDLRRRRREAVVIHDGDVDRPVGEEDVFMRGPPLGAGASAEEVMQRLVRSAEEVVERIEELEASLGDLVERGRE
jgi:hypothetical protein